MIRTLILVALLIASGPARADSAKPWANGVSEAEQQTALGLYREGNSEFEESRYAQALAKYRVALTHWDHPGIRFNMAVCLVNLDQPLEAMEHLEKALAYGEAPLGPEAYAQGLTYKKLLDGQLAELSVRCETAGAAVTFDGQPLVSCPGETKRRVLPGTHQLVASKQGFETETNALVLLPGKELVQAVALKPVKVRVQTRVVKSRLVRRWGEGRPWIVAGAGAGAALLGTVALVLASSEYNTYDQLLEAECPSGCGPTLPTQRVSEETRSHERAGKIWNVVGVSTLTLGSAALVAGLVGVYLNQPRTVTDDGPTIVPTVHAAGGGAAVRWSF